MNSKNNHGLKLITLLMTLCIVPLQSVMAGGYVDGLTVLNPATTAYTSASPTPTFNNAQFTNELTVGTVNNDPIKTPSTADPVSTVTGNNYHDETDFRIHGRNGLDYVFTRTYNSAPSSASVDSGLGFGWVHSYGMKLVSNNFGVNPNGATTTTTGSITYTDERGGQQNFLINAPAGTANPPCNNVSSTTVVLVTNPCGVFNTLTLDSPSAGQYTLTFRNGASYVFQDPNYTASTDMKTTPGKTARLIQINDAYGNKINLTYTGNNLTGIADNLGISGRSGLTLTYNTDRSGSDI